MTVTEFEREPLESSTPRSAGLRQDLHTVKPTLVAVGIALMAVIVAITVSLATSSSPPVGDVSVTETDFRIEMPTTLRAGKHTFAIANDGRQAHELVVFRTDAAASALPLDDNGDVNEDSPLMVNVADTGSDLAAGATRAVSARLRPGHYVAVCNLPGHYQLGMRVDLTIK